MKILMPVHCFLPTHMGGTEIYTYNLATELNKRHEVTVLYPEIDYKKEKYSISKGTYEGVPFYKIINNRTYSFFEETYNNPKMDKLFHRILDETKPDIVHLQHLLNLSVNFIRIAKEKDIPVIFTLHAYWLMCHRGIRIKKDIRKSMWQALEICYDINPTECARCVYKLSRIGIFADRCYGLLMKRTLSGFNNHNNMSLVSKNTKVNGRLKRLALLCDESTKTFRKNILWTLTKRASVTMVQNRLMHIKEMCKYVDLFIAPSIFLREEFIKFGIPEEKIIYSDNGMNMAYYKGITRRESEQVRFSFIGSMVPHKGVHVLIEAFNGIEDERAELNIYGDLSLQPQYSEMLIQIAKNPNIHFRGRFNNDKIGETLSGTDVLVVPSVWLENSPLVIHEAFITGVPVIASNLGGMADLVKHGVNGLLFKVGDANDLMSKMHTLIKEADLIERLRQGMTHVKTIEEDVLFMEELYIKLNNEYKEQKR